MFDKALVVASLLLIVGAAAMFGQAVVLSEPQDPKADHVYTGYEDPEMQQLQGYEDAEYQ